MESRFSKEACDIAEDLGRSLFEKLLKQQGVTQYGFSEYQFEVYDAWYVINGKKYIAEIKTRALKYSSFDDMLIEKSKYDAVVSTAEKFGATPLYVNVYEGSRKVKIANLNNVQPVWSKESHQITQLGSQQPIEKRVSYLKGFHTYILN